MENITGKDLYKTMTQEQINKQVMDNHFAIETIITALSAEIARNNKKTVMEVSNDIYDQINAWKNSPPLF